LSLTAYSGESIYIAFRHWDCDDQYALVIDDVTVSEFYGVDAELAQIITPVSGTNLSAAEPVKVLVKNSGANPLTGFSLKLELNGATIATETFTGTIASLSQAEYTFNATLNLAAAGSYTIKVTAIAADDGNPANDSKTVTVTNTVCAPVSLPFFENFDASLDLPSCWSTIDANNDGHDWYIMESGNDPELPMYDAHSAPNYAGSRTWRSDLGGFAADNYLITPPLAIPANGATLEYWVGQTYNEDGDNEHYSVLVSTTGTSAANFTVIFSETLTSTNWIKRTIPLPYAGNNIYIAFRHHDSYDIEILKIDDVKVTAGLGVSTITQNNDVKIYPNPSNGLVNIEVGDNAIVSLYDVTGRFISTHRIEAKGTLTLSQSVGLYFVKVECNGTISTHKLVITK